MCCRVWPPWQSDMNVKAWRRYLSIMAAVAMGRWLLLTPLVLLSVAAAPAPAPTPEGTEFFEKKIRPLLVDNCFRCHSASSEKLKGSLKLDSREAALRGGESGKPAIVPAEPEKSLLIEAVRWSNGDLLMPPKKQLSDQQIADLTTWIKMGAPYGATGGLPPAPSPVFWPAIAPQEVSVPRNLNPIDYFIQLKLREKNLLPPPPASKRALIRRATFDLIGL